MSRPAASSYHIRYGLLVKTMIVLIIIFIIPIMVLYSLLLKDTRSHINEDVHSHISVSLDNVVGTVDEIFNGVEAVSSQIKTDSSFNESSFSADLQERENYESYLMLEQISRSLYQYYLSNQYIHSIEVYNPYCNACFYSKVGMTRSIDWNPSDDMIRRISGPEGHHEKQWFVESEDGSTYFVLYFSPYFSNRPSKKLFARVTVPVSVVSKRFEALFPEKEADLYIRDAQGELAPICLSAEGSTAPHIPDEVNDGWFTSVADERDYINVFKVSEHTQWEYLAHCPIENFNSSLSLLDSYFYYFIICLGIILLISLFFLYTQIIHPMQVISKKMREAELGDFGVRIHFRQKDEIGYIGHRLNVLLHNTQELIQENYETRLQKNEFELKYIQTQFKEHFIYNTLDTIHWIANKHNVPEISDIIFRLSRLFRLTLNNGEDIVTVADACKILDDYLSLINVRTDNMIRYDIAVEDGLADQRVIKYPFQPIVENAYQHGIRPLGHGDIRISFEQQDDDRLRFSVWDSGAGIPPEQMEKIRKAVFGNEKEQGCECFALINIRQQLALYYGNRYEFLIESQENEGTRITLIFPLNQEALS